MQSVEDLRKNHDDVEEEDEDGDGEDDDDAEAPPRSCPSWPSVTGSRLPSPWGGNHGSSEDNHDNAEHND